MKHELKEISQSVKELIITIDAKTALADYHQVLKKFKQYVQIPGFRKGKAPVAKVEKMYGEYAVEQFYDDKLGSYYKKALEEIDANPINAGDATNVEWKKGDDLVATFRFEVMPEILVKQYKDLEIPYEATEFKTEMVDGTIEEFRNNLATEKEVDGELADGNIVKATFSFLDDEGIVTKSISREFAINNNVYCKSFNKKVVGSKVGDEFKNIIFTKSDKTQDNEIGDKFRGKEFLIKINSAVVKELPELNDEFAKDLEYDSMVQLRESIETELKKKIEKEDKDRMRSAIISELIAKNEFEMPHSLITKYAEDMAKPYAEAYKMDIEKLIPMYEQIADFNMKSHYLLEEIKKLENIKFTDEDKEALIAEEAKNAAMEIEKYKDMNKSQIESRDFLYMAEEDKVLDIIKNSSKFVHLPIEVVEEK